jgi:hypothetical protein
MHPRRKPRVRDRRLLSCPGDAAPSALHGQGRAMALSIGALGDGSLRSLPCQARHRRHRRDGPRRRLCSPRARLSAYFPRGDVEAGSQRKLASRCCAACAHDRRAARAGAADEHEAACATSRGLGAHRRADCRRPAPADDSGGSRVDRARTVTSNGAVSVRSRDRRLVAGRCVWKGV